MKSGRFNGWTAAHPTGMSLRPWAPAPSETPIVACVILKLDDLPALLEKSASWSRAVERVVVVLGAWTRREDPKELARARRTLNKHFGSFIEIVDPPEGGWPDQVAKRSAYFERVRPGEIAMVVDADEEIQESAPALRAAAAQAFDVGWITIEAPTRYARPYQQPRLFRMPAQGLKYQHRHYWVYRGDGVLMAKHSYAGPGFLHLRLPITFHNRGGERTPAHEVQWRREDGQAERSLDHTRYKLEPLRIAQIMYYDAGLVAYRLHTAINSTTRERSLMVSSQAADDNPLKGPFQFDLRDKAMARAVLKDADVAHVHISYEALEACGGARAGLPIVIHHHGTVYRNDPELANRLDTRAILRLASTWDLMLRDKTGTLRWLPNPMPVALYRRMAAAARAARGDDGLVRIVHTPSKPKLKGTAELEAAVASLRKRGLPVALDLITNTPHVDALWRKAAGDICFDSFWLGIQCSGLEAAAMGMPVVAGDPAVAEAYQTNVGRIPYTFADEHSLESVLERLVVDTVYRQAQRVAVGSYVLEYHDEAAVALRYLEMLRDALQNTNMTVAALQEHIAKERQARAKMLRQEPAKTEPVSPFRLHRRA